MKRSAVGVLNGNWKNKWRDEIVPPIMLSTKQLLDISLEVAENMMAQKNFPTVVEAGMKKAAEVREQLRLLEAITPEAQEAWMDEQNDEQALQAAELAEQEAWLQTAIAYGEDWLDEQATRESVRPL